MRTEADPGRLQAQVLAWRAEGLRVGFVPTMGFLHAGHTSLMDLAATRCDRLVVSIFVNPMQFGPGEDLDVYPRDPQGDAAKCAAHGCDLLFTPEAFYPQDFSTRVILGGITDRLCGARRPGHFEGVTTVVARLFGVVQPHVAVFGEKDYQQLAVIRRMVRDLAMPIEILGGELIRDHDGLALSSRNKYLSAANRERALTLHRALYAMRVTEDRNVERLLDVGRDVLDVDRIDYLEIVDTSSLEPLTTMDRPARALVAAFLGKTRLIDNVAL
ncbi:MAG: pantoate--beta-alanine ligase [Proteobacteria bacterium]|nr:pantoate--beta-alanine ligase [Pseudomonadota bacterium]MCP4918973.1 pantoate--beta-alanine ligase [Pseudomonadota bacterium]